MTVTGPEDIRLHDPDAFVESFPYEMLDWLRANDPVFRHEDDVHPDGPPFWAITKHQDVVTLSRDPEGFSSEERTALFREPEDEDELEQQRLLMLNMDPPQHTRIRAIVNKGFTPRMINRLKARIREFAEEIVDRALREGEGDFVRMVSAELPLEVIAELMGAPLDERDQIFELSNRLIGFDDPEFTTAPDDAEIASMEMYEYAQKMYDEREADPQDDIITKLVQAEVDGDKLSELEFNLFFLLLSVAGNETTRNAISNGMVAFFEHPEQWERLVEERPLETAAEEVIRWAHPVIHFRRTAMRDFELRGKQIREGDKVMLFYASANRDEDVFVDPYAFDITRDPNPHLSFGGGGPHFCLGRHLAALEVQILFDVVAERMPKIEQLGPPRRLRSNFINGIKELPVRFRG